MSMPEIIAGTSTREQAITDIISSVALEQTALSHILNAQGEAIQHIIPQTQTIEELGVYHNKTVELINSISELERILLSKLDLFKYCLCYQCFDEETEKED